MGPARQRAAMLCFPGYLLRPGPDTGAVWPCSSTDFKEEAMLESIMQALGLDEESRKRRQKAREKAREEERAERAERVRQDAQAMKKSVGS